MYIYITLRLHQLHKTPFGFFLSAPAAAAVFPMLEAPLLSFDLTNNLYQVCILKVDESQNK